ncbi:MAG TPA: 3-isopropylmalate dehydratase small subunit [Steroidobacteraceae bacterium]|nr:3-isopropylmalate dehydratase small subunit [Steroidobacteraceae bacterium]
MTPLTSITAVAVPLLLDNIDTDTIIPSREIRSTGKTGLAAGLFAGWRYQAPGGREPAPAFVLNQPRYARARILLAGGNFGCGSSREHAVWALGEHGIRVVIAPSFAPIFFGNCVRNGMLPAVLPAAAVHDLAQVIDADPQANPLTVDVRAQTVTLPTGRSWHFPLESEPKLMLLGGLDAIDLTLQMQQRIDAFLERDRLERPWIYLGTER